MKTSFLALLFAFIFLGANAQLTVAKLFGDHMVLQRGQDVPVWGWAPAKATVVVDFGVQHISAKADANGYWKAVLKPMQAGGPYVMKISSGREHFEYSDVMIGEVWICSGQSNMELVLSNAYGYSAELKNAKDEPIRQFHVPYKISLTPDKDLSGGQWVKADTNTIGGFTAVGYYFAKKLAAQLHVTVGLIHTSWGGTQVEDWISRDAMLSSPELAAAAKTMPGTWDEVKARIDKAMRNYAYRNQAVTNYTVQQLADEPASFFVNWQNGPAPGAWEWMGKMYSYRGQGFMQRTIKLDGSYANHASTLQLGITDADLDIYINGKQVQKGALSPNYQVQLPAGTWKGGDNSLLINLLSRQKKPDWYGMGLNSAGNDLFVHFSDTTVNLADNNWRIMPDLSKPYRFDYLPNNSAFMLYNAMVNPLIPYSFAGAIWYQGESNADRAYQYRTAFPLMITDWRNRWGKQFPFLFVQISSFGGFQNSNIGSSWAELREAQNEALKLPNTAVAVTSDIGDAFNIHPKDKADVGYRLANEALTMVYHLPNFPQTPMYNSVSFSDGAAIISFTHAPNGLMAKDKYGYVRGFEIAGADHKFYYAQATITADNKVKVWSSDVPEPAAVRYAWTDAPIDANLFSKEGMPVSPFRTDNWKGVTEGKVFE